MGKVYVAGLILLSAVAWSSQPLAATPKESVEALQVDYEANVSDAKAAMMSDPGAALTHARAAAASARLLPGTEAPIAEATGRWLEGEALTRLNQPEQAKPVIDAALATVVRQQPNAKLHADLLKSRATIEALTGKVDSALASLHQAHAIFAQLGDARSQAIVLQKIGSIYVDARDYPRALHYFEQANEAYHDDPSLTMASHNNRGNALKEMGEFEKAEQEFGLALDVARAMDSPLLEARIMTNIASAQLMRGALDQADATAVAGLRRATGAAAEWRPYLWGVRAQVAFARGDLPTARQYVERAFDNVDIASTTMLYRDFHDAAHKIYSALGQHESSLAHLRAFKRLDDEARDVAAKTNSVLMAARFDATNQELRIAKLKAQQAERNAMLAQSEQRLRVITLVTTIGGVAAVLIIGAISLAYATMRRSRREVSAANAQLTYAARHDGLTGLANRTYLRELVGQALDHARDGADKCALFLLDLDRFKLVNDTLGHHAGDELLRIVSRRIEAVVGVRAHVGRLGGDEFAVVFPRTFAGIDALAAKLVTELSAPYELEAAEATVGATIGIAVGTADGETVDALFRSADLALYRAKEAGRGRHARYEAWMQAEADEARMLERDLRVALEEDRLSVAYQPIVDAGSGETVAYEALLRWQHPTRGEIPPAVFVPIAEEARLIHEIGAWVLRTACAEAATWPEHIKVAVNLSAMQVETDGLATTVVNALASTGLQPERLELEVTESVFLRQGARTDAMLDRLRAIGVSLALDDFGTGYSSLGYLQRASFSKIKIDRSFVQAATGGCKEAIAIIQAIIALADGLGMETTAEGVETDDETLAMRKLGCSQLQGYKFGRPDSATEAPAVQVETATPEAVDDAGRGLEDAGRRVA